ncbi:MAG: hypothetical protein ACNI3C_10385 [Candidatus Marinarcus sp.]|uniref:hypothetical protein n=1 Tax=Candidatus Marinarcus sp. TaxID=3100987 RepID=UPI003B000225
MVSLKIVRNTLLLFVFASTSLMADTIASVLATNNNACYKSREMMYGIDDVFEALKKTLLQSNLNIVTVTKEDGVLTAKGSQYNVGEDTVTDITMSISFRSVGENKTHITAIGSFNTQEKKSEMAQIGAAGVSLPIPVPLTGRYAVTGSGNIDNSIWYQGFYNSVSLALFENKMRYSTSTPKVQEPVKEEKTVQEVSTPAAPAVEVEEVKKTEVLGEVKEAPIEVKTIETAVETTVEQTSVVPVQEVPTAVTDQQ